MKNFPLPKPRLVDHPDSMERFLREVADERRLAVDTEANSMHAFKERVCLIQVSVPGAAYVLDPLGNISLAGFWELCRSPRVCKVFHDAEYDLLLLRRDFGIGLENLYDTKVAAVALGQNRAGLASVVERYFGIQLDKKWQRSDWGRRPLKPQQLEYAVRDTHFLLPLMDRLEEEISAGDAILRHEIESEFSRLCRLDPPPKEDKEAYKRVKGARKLSPTALRAFKELHDWCRSEAERRDVPMFKVIGNSLLLSLARQNPRTREQILGLLPGRLEERFGGTLLRVLEQASRRQGIRWDDASGLEAVDEECQRVLDRLRAWRKDRAGRRPTDPSHILNREVMEDLAGLNPPPGCREDLEATGLLEDWRIEAYGEEILRVLASA